MPLSFPVEGKSASGDTRAAAWQEAFLARERLPTSYLATAAAYFDPLAANLAARAAQADDPFFVAINGSQGSGKTTLGAYLLAALRERAGLTVVSISLDDFYLTLAEREQLAASVHPLLRTRGVPGTHDTKLLARTLQLLRESRGEDEPVALPAFSKADDDRKDSSQWLLCQPPIDVVLLEGWCLGCRSVPDNELAQPLNALERNEDAEGSWRRYSNQCLREQYEPLYEFLDYWIMLQAPSFERVLAWREEQEQKLAMVAGEGATALMNHAQLQRFVAHYERHTRNCLTQLPQRVDALFVLDEQRRITDSRDPGPMA